MPFDPTAPVEEVETPGQSGGFDPNKPFELDLGSVGDHQETANQIVDGLSDLFSTVSGIPAPLAKLVLKKGGKKTDIAIQTLLPIAGGAVGAAAGGVGAPALVGAGGAAGDALVQIREMVRGERDKFSAGSTIGSGAVSAFIPKPLQTAGGSVVRNLGRAVVQRGKEGAILGATQEAIREVIDDGEISIADIAEHGLWGAPFGAAFGVLEKAAPAVWQKVRGKAPKEAVKILREEPLPTREAQVQAQSLADRIDESLGILPETATTAEESMEAFEKSARERAKVFGGKEAEKTPVAKLNQINEVLKRPDIDFQYSVWDREMLPPGMDRTVQVDIIPTNPSEVAIGGLGSTNRRLLKELGVDLPPAPDWLPPGRYTRAEVEKAIADGTPPTASAATEIANPIEDAAGVSQPALEAPAIETPQARRAFDNYGFATAPVINALSSAGGGGAGFLYGFNTSEDKSPDARLKRALAFGAAGAAAGYGLSKGTQSLGSILTPEARIALRQKFEDDWIRTRKLTEKAGVNISDEGNPYQKYRLMPGRVGVAIDNKDQFARKLVGEMTDSAKEAGLDPKQLAADVNGYLQARHAPERNADLGDGAAGMTNAQAQQALDAINASSHADKIKEFADTIQEFNSMTLDTLLEGQVITRELYDQLKQRYPNHVPLNRIKDEDPDVGPILSTRGMDVKKTGIIKAKGSDLPVDDILGNVLTNYEQAVMRAEKNRVNLATLKFARDNPELGLFEEVSQIEKGNPSVLELRENGEPVYLKINDPKLAPVLKTMDREQLTGVLRFVGSFTRLFSGLLTRFNPEFVLTNKLRDLQETAAYLSSKQDLKSGSVGRALARDAASIKDVFDGIRGSSTPGAKLYQQMREDGGTTGGMALSTRNMTREELDDLWKVANSPGRKGARAAIELIDSWNTIAEDSTRLSIYKQALDSGVSRDRAAYLAKEGTIDFNRMGTAGPVVNALYAFSNASIQGSAKLLRAMKNPRVAAGVIGTVAGAVVATNQWNDQIDPDWRKKVPRWDRLNSLPVLLPDPSDGGKFRYIAVPISWGLKPIKVAADSAADAMRGDTDATEAFIRVGTAIAEGYNPVGGTDFIQSVTPTILDPAVDVARNRTFSGSMIKPDSDPYAPESTRYFPSLKQSVFGRALIEGTKEAAKATNGRIEISPADLYYLAGQATGGAGKFVNKVATTAGAAVGANDLKTSEIPFVSRVYRESTPEDQNRFVQNPALDQALQEQSRTRFYDREKAHDFVDNLKKLEPSARQGALNGLSDDEYDAVLRVLQKQATAREVQKMKMLSSKTGARAMFIRDELMKLNPEDRNAYFQKLDEDGIIDDPTYDQLMALLQGRN